MKNVKLKVVLGGVVLLGVAACGTIDPAKVAKIDPTGKGEFLGLLVRDQYTDKDLLDYCSKIGAKNSCDATKYKPAQVYIANGYWSGMARADGLIPKTAPAVSGQTRGALHKGDIVRMKFNGEVFMYVETVARYGDDTCKWEGNGIFEGGIDSGGVECPRHGFSYKTLDYNVNGMFK